MKKQQILLKRILKDPDKKNFQKVPDYSGFFKGENGHFYVVGYLDSRPSSNLKLSIQKVTTELRKNKYLEKEYDKWRDDNFYQL